MPDRAMAWRNRWVSGHDVQGESSVTATEDEVGDDPAPQSASGVRPSIAGEACKQVTSIQRRENLACSEVNSRPKLPQTVPGAALPAH
jgi:hypothetical protein